MRDDICTIPISEAFEKQEGCPICNMYKTVEERILTYIMGAAMMEPDVRIQTNKNGFCINHYKKMLNMRGRLSLALMLETHISETEKNKLNASVFGVAVNKNIKAIEDLENTCFVCEKINWGITRMISTLYKTYSESIEFKEIFEKSESFCLPHYKLLMKGANKQNLGKSAEKFIKTVHSVTENYMKELIGDVKYYCSMYDYRNNKGDQTDWKNSKDSVERAISFLTGNTDVL